MNPKQIILYCGLLLSLSAFSVDITLPVFTNIRDSLGVPMESVKFTVPAYLFGFGSGQILFGPLADKYGRRFSIAAGLCLFLLGTLLALFAADINVLILGRLLQGFGGATGIVVSRAIIRDLYQGRELARAMATAMAIFSLGPLIAPLLGYALAVVAGWRAVFAAIFVFGGALLYVALRWLPETAKTRIPDAMTPQRLCAQARRFFTCSRSLYFTFAGAWMTMSMHFYLTNAPQLYQENFNVGGFFFAVLFSTHSIGIIVGQIANRAAIKRFGVIPAITAALILLVVAMTTAITVLLVGGIAAFNVFSFTALILVFVLGYLIVVSNSAAMAMEDHGDIAGFASSIIGLCTFTFGAAAAFLFTLLTDGKLLPVLLIMLGISVTKLVAMLLWQRHERRVK